MTNLYRHRKAVLRFRLWSVGEGVCRDLSAKRAATLTLALLMSALMLSGCNTNAIYGDDLYNPPVYWGSHVVKPGKPFMALPGVMAATIANSAMPTVWRHPGQSGPVRYSGWTRKAAFAKPPRRHHRRHARLPLQVNRRPAPSRLPEQHLHHPPGRQRPRPRERPAARLLATSAGNGRTLALLLQTFQSQEKSIKVLILPGNPGML